MKVKFRTDTKTVDELKGLWEQRKLNLEPAFQRESVWKLRQRRKLIKSLYEGCPVPSVFLYSNFDAEKICTRWVFT